MKALEGRHVSPKSPSRVETETQELLEGMEEISVSLMRVGRQINHSNDGGFFTFLASLKYLIACSLPGAHIHILREKGREGLDGTEYQAQL